MKLPNNILFSSALLSASLVAEEPTSHRSAAENVANQQDELAADVQQLVIEQTVPEVIELLNQAGDIMDEVTDQLSASNTGGETIAAQTEIIEKIHGAAKEKQKQGGSGQAGGAMMDMMERMMGKAEGEPKKGKDGEAGGDKGGQGNGEQLSDSPNDVTGGPGDGKNEARRVPKAAGSVSSEPPEEFRKVLDAYNRGAEQKVK